MITLQIRTAHSKSRNVGQQPGINKVGGRLCLGFLLCFLSQAVTLRAQNDSSDWVKSIHESNKSSIVFITGNVKHQNGAVAPVGGTGFIVSSEGYVLTCNHVVPEYNSAVDTYEIWGSVGGRYNHQYPLKIVDDEKVTDLLLLTLPQEEEWRTLTRATKWKPDSELLVLGFPEGRQLLTVTGRITSLDDNGRLITNAAINHGMSGGPVFNRDGAVIAVAEAGYEEANDIYVLIPISYANKLLHTAYSPLLDSNSSSGSALPNATTPAASSSTAGSLAELQEQWDMVIFRLRDSQLAKSYVPNQLHVAQLTNSIRDAKNIRTLIEGLVAQVNDRTLLGWLNVVDYDLGNLQEDLTFIGADPKSPDVMKLNEWQETRLQTAEYSRVNALTFCSRISIHLKLPDPGFSNLVATTVLDVRPNLTPTPISTPTPAATPTPVATARLEQWVFESTRRWSFVTPEYHYPGGWPENTYRTPPVEGNRQLRNPRVVGNHARYAFSDLSDHRVSIPFAVITGDQRSIEIRVKSWGPAFTFDIEADVYIWR